NTWGGVITFSGSVATIGVDAGSDLTSSGPNGGTAPLFRKVGAGRLIFSGPGSFNGDSEVAAGTLVLRGDTNAGSHLGELRVLSGATRELEDRTAPVGEDITRLSGIGVNGAGALRVTGGTAAVTSPISLEAGARIGVEGPDTVLTLNGMISGAAAPSL